MTAHLFPIPTNDIDEPAWAGHGRRGDAAELLVVADLKIRGFDAAQWFGANVDVVGEIYGYMRRLQVKSKNSEPLCFGNARHPNGNSRTLMSYKGKIDAFAFIFLPTRLVYYVAIEAVSTPTVTLTKSSFNRQACDLSFTELLRRWKQVSAA